MVTINTVIMVMTLRKATDSPTTWQERNLSLSFFILSTGSSIMKPALAQDWQRCRASFFLDVIGEDANDPIKQAVEGKLDICGSVSLSHSSHLLVQDIKDL